MLAPSWWTKFSLITAGKMSTAKLAALILTLFFTEFTKPFK